MKDLTNLIHLEDNQLITTSRDISKVFNKRHDDVLKKIRNLDCGETFTDRNFAVSTYIDPTGRELVSYNITRDGLVFLIMGFTGKKAAEFKEAYINAFNQMENQLRLQAQEESKRLLKNEKLRSGAYKRMRDSFQEQLEDLREYHHQEVSKWQYEVEKMRKDSLSINFNKPKKQRIEKYDVYHLTTKNLDVDIMLNKIKSAGYNCRNELEEVTSMKILLRILNSEVNRYKLLAHEISDSRVTSTIYSHELVGLC